MGHWSQKHSASCLLHFLLATLPHGHMANASAFSVKRYHAKIFYTPNLTRVVYFDTTTHELRNSSIMLVSHFQFSDFWWQDPLSRHQSRLCIVPSVFTRTYWVWKVVSSWVLDLNAVCESYTTRLIVFEWVWQVVFDSLFLYSWEWYNELGLTLTAWQALMDTACTDRPTGRRLRSYFANCCGNLDVAGK